MQDQAKTKKQLIHELSELRRRNAELKSSERKLKIAESTLRKNEEKYYTIYDNSALGIFECAPDGRLNSANQAFARMFGYDSPHEAVRKLTESASNFDSDLKKQYKTMGKVLEENVAGRFEIRHKRKDGSMFTGSSHVHAVHDKQGNLLSLYGFVEDITERKLQEEEAKQFSRRLISLMEKERKRIARDLHDVFGQTLTGLHLMVESLRDCLPDNFQKHKAKCDELIAMIEEAVDFVRHISYRIRPDMLDDLGLVPTMQSYIRGFAVRKPELCINIRHDNFTDNIDTETKLVLYRIFQEALHNIAKHAHARTANVYLEYTHPKVVLTIEDDGVGIPVQIEDLLQLSGINEKGIGLISIRERAASVGGNVSIRSKKDKGTTLKVEVDISRRQKDAQNQSVSG